MSTPVTPTPRPSTLPTWLVPAGLMVLAGLGLALVSANWSPPEAAPPESERLPEWARRVPPQPPEDTDPGGLYSIVPAVENGTRVVKIQAVAGGDELVVDAETGKLLETRPAAPAGSIKPVLLAP
jgi:hypothetical protein